MLAGRLADCQLAGRTAIVSPRNANLQARPAYSGRIETSASLAFDVGQPCAAIINCESICASRVRDACPFGAGSPHVGARQIAVKI